jgi:hypothetical protein
MPRFDGSGPAGLGAGTGRGVGPCGAGARGGYGGGYGAGYGSGYGYGPRLGRRFFTRREENEMLTDEATSLEEELKAIKERLAEIENQK